MGNDGAELDRFTEHFAISAGSITLFGVRRVYPRRRRKPLHSLEKL